MRVSPVLLSRIFNFLEKIIVFLKYLKKIKSFPILKTENFSPKYILHHIFTVWPKEENNPKFVNHG